MKRDVRSFILIKSAIDNSTFVKLDTIGSASIKSGLMPFLAFGDYDAIYTYKINECGGNLLKDISKENELIVNSYNGSIFLHPVYAVLNFDEENDEKDVHDFWDNNDSNFLLFSSVYIRGMDVSSDSIKAFQHSVKSKFKNNLDFSCLIYKSLDISDYIIVWKSNNIRTVVEAIKELYLSKDFFIGYINTICAINYLHLSSDENRFISYKQKIDPDEMLDIANIYNVTSPHNSFRFNDLITGLNPQSEKNASYFVLGNDDYINTFNRIPTRELFRLLRETFVENNKSNKNCDIINRTFTHIGVSIQGDVEKRLKDDCEESKKILTNRKKLFNICKMIHYRLFSIKLSNLEVFSKMEWINVSLELSNLMMVMSQSDVYESVCLLLIDSVSFFCSWLEYVLENQKNQSQLENKLYVEDDSIQSFVRSWKQLIDNVVHSDGVSVHTPGYSLLSYNIFNTILEYCGAYFREISLLFMDQISNENIQLAYIISPKLCRRIKTKEIFFEKQDKDSLLSLEIPISDMLNPLLILSSLTHEAAHYCGELTRLKSLRQRVFISAIVQIVCDSLNITFADVNIKLFEIIEHRLIKSMGPPEAIYLKELIFNLNKTMHNILSSHEDIGTLISIYFNLREQDCDEERISFALEASYKLLNGFNSIDDHIERIGYFLKECYADLIMIYVLKLSFVDYINVLMTEFKRLDIQDELQRNKFITIFHRALMVRQACCEELKDFNSNIDMLNIEEINLKQYIIETTKDFDLKYQQFISIRDSSTRVFRDGFYSLDVFYSIILYLTRCLQKFDEKVSRETRLVELRNMFNTMISNDGFFTPKFHNIINDFRIQVLSNYCDDGKIKNNYKFE